MVCGDVGVGVGFCVGELCGVVGVYYLFGVVVEVGVNFGFVVLVGGV